MTIVGIRELRDGLSKHIAAVRDGATITVTDHGEPVARITPIGAPLRHGLRGYDAVHCAAALWVAGPDLVAATGDPELLSAWRDDGLSVVDTNT